MKPYASNQLVTKLNTLRGALTYDRQAIRRAKEFNNPSKSWSFWMNEAKKDKRALRREAISLHWYLYLSGKSDVRPSVDMPMQEMSRPHVETLMKYYRDTIKQARIPRQAC